MRTGSRWSPRPWPGMVAWSWPVVGGATTVCNGVESIAVIMGRSWQRV